MINEHIETHKLIIEGMDCQDEVRIIEKKLRSLAGVKDLDIYLATQGVKVVYDPSSISIQQIIKSIAETGMKAFVVKEARLKTAWWKEKRIIALSVCGLFTLTAFVLEKIGWKGIITIILHSTAIIVGGYYPAKMAFGRLKDTHPQYPYLNGYRGYWGCDSWIVGRGSHIGFYLFAR